MTALLVKLAVRFVLFGAVFAFAAHRSPRIKIQPKLALPLVALVFALLNTGMYWLLKPVLNIATFGAAWLVIPLVLNGAFLWTTRKILRPLKIDGILPMLWLSLLLTAAHGLTWLVLDHLVLG